MINNDQIQDYLKKGGEECLHCKSLNIFVIESVPRPFTPGTILQTVECHDCGELWKAEFILMKVYVENENNL